MEIVIDAVAGVFMGIGLGLLMGVSLPISRERSAALFGLTNVHRLLCPFIVVAAVFAGVVEVLVCWRQGLGMQQCAMMIVFVTMMSLAMSRSLARIVRARIGTIVISLFDDHAALADHEVYRRVFHIIDSHRAYYARALGRKGITVEEVRELIEPRPEQ